MLGALGLAAVAALVYMLVVSPRLELARREGIIQRLAALRDRVKRDASDQEAVKLLMGSMRSRDSFERTQAIAFIGQVGDAAESAVDALIASLRGADLYNAREAARSLGEIGPAARRSVPALKEAVQLHPHADIGWFAVESLGSVADPSDAAVVALLRRETNSSDSIMCKSAEIALETLYRRSASPHESQQQKGKAK